MLRRCHGTHATTNYFELSSAGFDPTDPVLYTEHCTTSYHGKAHINVCVWAMTTMPQHAQRAYTTNAAQPKGWHHKLACTCIYTKDPTQQFARCGSPQLKTGISRMLAVDAHGSFYGLRNIGIRVWALGLGFRSTVQASRSRPRCSLGNSVVKRLSLAKEGLESGGR